MKCVVMENPYPWTEWLRADLMNSYEHILAYKFQVILACATIGQHHPPKFSKITLCEWSVFG